MTIEQVRRAQEQLRYSVLEHVYLQSGQTLSDRALSVNEIQADLGVGELALQEAVSHLVRTCRYLRDPDGSGHYVSLTRDGLHYLRKEAGLRQSVRDSDRAIDCAESS